MGTRALMPWAIAVSLSFTCCALGATTSPEPIPSDPYSAVPLPATADPLSWESPAAAPEPRRRLDDEALRRRSDAALKALPTSQPAASTPLVSLRVEEVEPKSQADAGGIRKGDLLVALDDAPLWASEQLISLRTRTAQVLTVFTRAGQQRQVKINRGAIGLSASAFWDARCAYLQDPQRSAKYDADLLIAAAAVQSDPPLAETALRDAFERGYRGYVLDGLMAMIADREWRYDDVLSSTARFLKQASPPERAVFARLAYLAALRTFKLDLARTLLKDYPDADPDPNAPDRLDASIAAFRHLPAEEAPNPIEKIRGMRFRDATHEVTVAHNDDDRLCREWSEATALKLAGEGSLLFNIRPGGDAVAACGPAGADADLQVRFHFGRTDGIREAGRDCKLTLIVADGAANRDGVGSSPYVARVTFFNSGLVELVRNGAPDLTASIGPSFGAARQIHARIVVVGHRMEVVVDGHRLLYGPVLNDPSVRQLSPELRLDGIKGAIEEFTWRLPEVPAAGG